MEEMNEERDSHSKSIEDIHRAHEQQINDEKENIKVQFEQLMGTFQRKENEMQTQINQLLSEKENFSKTIEEDQKLKDIEISQLKQKVGSLQEKENSLGMKIKEIETEKDTLSSENESLKSSLASNGQKLEKLCLEKDQMEHQLSAKHSDEGELEKVKGKLEAKEREVEEFSKKLSLSINNAKRVESEVS